MSEQTDPSHGRTHLKSARTGRPLKLSQPLIDKVANFLRIGVYVETAAIASGMSKQTFYTYLRQANDLQERIEKAKTLGERVSLIKHEKLLLLFLDAIEKATAEAETSDVVTIKQASKTNWQAAAWRLERKNPDRWGRRDFVKSEVSGPGGAPVPISTEDTTGMTGVEKDELLARHYERIQRQKRQSGASDGAGIPAPV
jgi:transposase